MDRLGIAYFVTGSHAAMLYGEPRLTYDIDVAVHLRLGDLRPLVEMFAEPEFYLDADSLRQAVETDTQTNIIHVPSGVKIDLMHPPRTAYHEMRFSRARVITIANTEVRVAAPEDVILMKLVYYHEGKSEKHLRDIASILKVSEALIDRVYINRWAPSLGVGDAWRNFTAGSGDQDAGS
jgi:hypothetical protein